MNVLSFVANVEHGSFVARSATLFANKLHIREKLHFHSDRTISLAGFAAASGYIEREMARAISVLLRFGE